MESQTDTMNLQVIPTFCMTDSGHTRFIEIQFTEQNTKLTKLNRHTIIMQSKTGTFYQFVW